MEATQVWILTAVATVLLMVCGWAGKTSVGLVLKRLDKIAELLQDLQLSRATHNQDIRALQEGHADHEVRIRKIEFKSLTETL